MKKHLRQGKKSPYNEIASCNHNHAVNDGVCGLLCVSPEAFRELNDDIRCKHCETVYLKRRNIQRKLKGLKSVIVWNYENNTLTKENENLNRKEVIENEHEI